MRDSLREASQLTSVTTAVRPLLLLCSAAAAVPALLLPLLLHCMCPAAAPACPLLSPARRSVHPPVCLHLCLPLPADPTCTTMQMCGRNGTEVLARITNVLTGAGLSVSSANINTGAEGPVCDIFRITNSEGKQVGRQAGGAMCCAALGCCMHV